jgi:hypothetical protein
MAVRERAILISICFCLVTCAGAADRLSDLKLSAKSTDLLQGRLTVRLPEEAHSTPAQHGIMAAPEAGAEITRIEIEAGAQKMVLLAEELFARTGQEFEKDVKEKAATLPTKVEVEPWPLPSPLRAYACMALGPEIDKEADLVMGLYVAQGDGTVEELAFFINQEAATNFAAATELAKSIARTIAPGTTKLNTSAGERKLSAYEGDLLVTVPEGFVLTEQEGPDFFVYHLRKITSFSESPAAIGIYLGDHPPRNDENMKANGSVTLLGQRVQWFEQEVDVEGERGLYDRALIKVGSWPSGQDHPGYVDVFLQARNGSGINELKKIAGTLKFEGVTKEVR